MKWRRQSVDFISKCFDFVWALFPLMSQSVLHVVALVNIKFSMDYNLDLGHYKYF